MKKLLLLVLIMTIFLHDHNLVKAADVPLNNCKITIKNGFDSDLKLSDVKITISDDSKLLTVTGTERSSQESFNYNFDFTEIKKRPSPYNTAYSITDVNYAVFRSKYDADMYVWLEFEQNIQKWTKILDIVSARVYNKDNVTSDYTGSNQKFGKVVNYLYNLEKSSITGSSCENTGYQQKEDASATTKYFQGDFSKQKIDFGADQDNPTIPVVEIAGNKDIGRPGLKFKLTKVILQGAPINCDEYETRWSRWDNSIATSNEIYFYFTYEISNYGGGDTKNEPEKWPDAIRLGTTYNVQFVNMGSGSVTDNVTTYKDISIGIEKNSVSQLYNYTFNSPAPANSEKVCGDVTKVENFKYSEHQSAYSEGKEPSARCLNVNGVKGYCESHKTNTGWLAKWDVYGQSSSYSNPTGTAPTKCGSLLDVITDPASIMTRAFCGIGVILHDAATRLMGFAETMLKSTIGIR